MLEACFIGFKGLTDDEKDSQPDNGSGKEYSTYLRIIHDGKTITVYSDAMEPEDCNFGRDLNWVVGAIRDAYKLGKQDAQVNLKNI